MTNENFKYYEVRCTSLEILKVWMKVPASIDEEDVYLKAREIDGGNFISVGNDWEYSDTIEIDEDSERMLDEPIEYSLEDFEDA